MSPGYQALRETAAWLDLSDRGKIRVTGEDRARLLHAILSNEVQKLGCWSGNYQFLLDAHGHILADANLYVQTDSMLLDCEPEMTGRIIEHLEHYIVADDVKLEDVTEQMPTLALEGPQYEPVGMMKVPPGDRSHIRFEGVTASRTSATGQPGYRLFLDGADRKRWWIEWFEQHGAVAATAEDARVVRVENGVPRYGEDFGATTLPQETQQFHAWSYDKGCYLGQEIVERIRARGHVNRLLVRVAIEGAEPPAAGEAVMGGGGEVGRLTSPVYSPRLGCAMGLAILRREFVGAEAALEVAGRGARVVRQTG